MMFGHAENKHDIEKYDSAQFNFIGFDELTHFLEYQYIYLVGSRLRSADSNLPAIARSASNPGREGHGWVRKRFVEPHREGFRILKDKATGNLRIYIPARLTDNPFILESDPTYALRLQLLTEAEKRAKLYGDWWTYEGQVFNFREERLVDEPENALHVIDPFRIPPWWPRFLSVDWGFSANTAGHWATVSPNGRIYVYREYVKSQKLISDWALDLRKMSTYEDGSFEDLKEVHLDPSAWKRTGHAETIAQQFERYSGWRPFQADNDRIGGKNLIQDYLRWTPKPRLKESEAGGFDPELAQRILRNHGPAKLKQYIEFFQPEPEEDNLPKVQIFNSCPNLINVIQQCVYDEDNKEDVKAFDGDDSYDNFRYLLQAAHRYAIRADKIREDDTQAKIAAAHEYLNKTNDMTGFYRRVEHIEAKAKQNFGIRRRSVFSQRRRRVH
jgi:hypothetical protein